MKTTRNTKFRSSELDKLLSVIATRQRSGETTGFNAFLPNPDAMLSKMSADAGHYDKLKDDPHIWSCIQSRKAGVLSLLWGVDKGLEKNIHSGFVLDCLERLNIRKIISEMLDATAYGYQPLEVIWRINGTNVTPSTIIGKPPHWFGFDENNSLRFQSKNDLSGELVPARKILLVQNEASYLNPYGIGYLPKCFWSWTFKKGGLKFWVRFTEKYGSPFVYGKVPRNAEQTEIDDLLEMLENIAQDGTGVVPDDAEIDYLDATKSSSPQIYQVLLDFCNTEISKAILSQTLTTQQGSSGSYAMSKTHFEVRQDVIDSDVRLVESAFNTLIRWIIDLNFDDAVNYPTFEMYRSTDVDKELAERDKMLWDSGFVKPTQKYLDSAYGFDDGEMIVIEKTPEVSPFAEPEDDVNQNLKKDSTNKLNPAYRKMLFSVAKLIENASSYDELELSLKNVFPMLSVDEITEMISQATLLGRVGGELDVLAEREVING